MDPQQPQTRRAFESPQLTEPERERLPAERGRSTAARAMLVAFLVLIAVVVLVVVLI